MFFLSTRRLNFVDDIPHPNTSGVCLLTFAGECKKLQYNR